MRRRPRPTPREGYPTVVNASSKNLLLSILIAAQRLKKLFRLGSLWEILAQCDCLLDGFPSEFFLTVLIVGKSKVIENRWILAFEFFIALLQKTDRGRICPLFEMDPAQGVGDTRIIGVCLARFLRQNQRDIQIAAVLGVIVSEIVCRRGKVYSGRVLFDNTRRLSAAASSCHRA